MHIKSIETHRIFPNESLLEILDTYVPNIQEEQILVVTSKIVSLCEGSVVQKGKEVFKEDLIRQSADACLLVAKEDNPYNVHLTLKNNLLIPSAGIDESNGNGTYILYPKNVQKSAASIWSHLQKRHRLKNVGVIITDSHTTPMRRGVLGIGLGWCGFKALYSYIGKPDCFESPLRVTLMNVLDALAVSAVFCMGEGNEQTPLALISDAPKIEFQERPPDPEEVDELRIPMNEDLYVSLLSKGTWVFPT